jgi:glycosyltransferase involved in cell wall biosynthesis
MIQPMRIAWFSPLPPLRSGIAAYSAELLPFLAGDVSVDCFVQHPDRRSPAFDAHDFVWRHQRSPYGLVVYQLGNAPCHDYMWAYLARYPGLVVLHDARLHHARARHLLQQGRFDDYRAEFRYDHPDAVPDFTEFAVEGLSGPIYYFWSMLRVVVTTARMVVVHNPRVATGLRHQFPGAAIQAIRMGVAPDRRPPSVQIAARGRVRRDLALPDDAIVFAGFGRVTAEKRIGAILRALAALTAAGVNAQLMLVGDTADYPAVTGDLARLGIADRVRVTNYVADEEVADYLAAADVCLCLRWPTAQETSASWLRCLAAGKPTVISDLSHLVDVPGAVARRIDLLDEGRALLETMRELAADPGQRADLARAGHEYWEAGHTLEIMAADYRRVLDDAAARPAPAASELPAHFTRDYTERTRHIARQFGVDPRALGL